MYIRTQSRNLSAFLAVLIHHRLSPAYEPKLQPCMAPAGLDLRRLSVHLHRNCKFSRQEPNDDALPIFTPSKTTAPIRSTGLFNLLLLLLSWLKVLVEVSHDISNAGHLVCFLIRNLQPELLLKCHD